MALKTSKGDKYGRLIILKETEKRGICRYFLCECTCGIKKEIALANLSTSKTRSCGCLRRVSIKKGDRFSRLIVIKEVVKQNKNRRFLCECTCGIKKEIDVDKLRNKKTRSCGCLKNELLIKMSTTHKMSKTRMYHCYQSMKNRCLNKKNIGYKYYGGRGITVCKRWLESFENFHKDMKEGYSDELTLDRKDNDGNYCKENCRWATMKEQANNRKTK